MEGTKASLTDDGRVNIDINQTSRTLSNLLVPALRQQLELVDQTVVPPPYIPVSLGGEPGQLPPPPLNVAIHVVGSRGDVQPFVALGKVLKEQYGHRVRLATHPVFADFVKENGLEFFSIGGDPAELMAFMVKNPGLMPGIDTLRSGDIGKRRKEIATMIKGCWRSCIEAGDGMGPEASDSTREDWMNTTANDDHTAGINPANKPFIADAIIANPPSFAHVHCAEKLGCPLHIMFTMPYSPTQAFPHPLANIQSSNTDPNLANFMSYALVDMMTWQGLGDIINRFREKSLNLDPVSLMWAPGMLARLRVPHTYCWSPALIPKPKDWGNHITLAGFYMLDLSTSFTPDPDLQEFLDAGPPPIYIGFGSIVLDDPNAMTKLIFDAVRKSGQRALFSKGWGGMGADQLGIPDSVFMLGNVPHDWLFDRVSCVVHHGGAGTTAAGIAKGKPTVIVPFFGDQPFWGSMVAKAGAGPEPIPHKQLTADNLSEAILTALKPESLERAHELAAQISHEQGTQEGSAYFHQFLDLDKMRCLLAPKKAAVWRVRRTDVGLSALAATTLATEGLLNFKDLKLYRAREYDTDEGPWDPITGSAGALVGTISTMMMGFADFPVAALKALNVHPDSAKKKKAKQEESTDGNKGGDGSTPEAVEREGRSPVSSGTSTPTSSSVSHGNNKPAGTFNLNESLAKVGGQTSPGSASPDLTRRSSSMASSLLDQARSPSRSRSQVSGSQSHTTSNTSQAPAAPAEGGQRDMMGTLEDVMNTGKGISKIVSAGFKSPMDFTQGLSKGFHNAPKLYGDNVRKVEPVTDFRSGLKVASKEFGYGFYDGITGLVTQPLEGAQKEGAAGFVKGFGKGIGGIVFKPGAAIFGIPAYTMKGVYKELQQQMGSSVQNYIIAARTAQGYDELKSSTQQEREDIIRRWYVVQRDLKKKRLPHEQLQDVVAEQRAKLRGSGGDGDKPTDDANARSARSNSGNLLARLREGLDYQRDRRVGSGGASDMGRTVTAPSGPLQSPPITVTGPESLQHSRTLPAQGSLDDTIRASVAESSRGNPEEDALIERAIRASMAELTSRPPNYTESAEDEEEHYRRALEDSIAEAERYARQHPDGVGADDEELAKALKASLDSAEARHHSNDRVGATGGELNESSDDDQIHEEDLKRAISASRLEQEASALPPAYQDEKEYQKAMQASQEQADAMTKQEEEEKIVMEYVKKQSLQEEEHRKQLLSKGKQKENLPTSDDPADSEDELQKAIKMSMGREGAEGGSSK